MIYWLIAIPALLFFVLFVEKRTNTDLPKWMFFFALILKIMAGLLMGWIFHQYYPNNDSISFYQSALRLMQDHSYWEILNGDTVYLDHINQSRVLNFEKVLVGFLLLTGKSYWLTTIYFSVISFLAFWYVVIEFHKIYPRLREVVVISFFFIPSVIFWSSGILKDTLAFCALAILVIQILKLYESERLKWWEFILSAISLVILLKIKHYLLIIFLLFCGLTLTTIAIRRMRGNLKWAVALLALATSLISTQLVHPYLRFQRLTLTVYENNLAINLRTAEEKQLGIYVEDPSIESIIQEVPRSLYTGLYKPLWLDKTPFWGLIHKIENLILLSLSIFSLIILIKERIKVNWSLVGPSLLCIALLATMLALSTPNIGTLIRYKNAFIPFFFIIVGILPYKYLMSKKL